MDFAKRYGPWAVVAGASEGIGASVARLLGDQGEEAHIVNTASAAALRYVPSSALYNATKFGVVALTESLRQELAPHRIGVSVLCPGGVATNIGQTMHGTIGRRRSDEEVRDLLAAFATVDASASGTPSCRDRRATSCSRRPDLTRRRSRCVQLLPAASRRSRD